MLTSGNTSAVPNGSFAVKIMPSAPISVFRPLADVGIWRGCSDTHAPEAGAMSRDPKQQQPTAKSVTIKDPARSTGTLKRVGGSQSDDWNNRVINDTLQVLWIKNSDQKEYDQQMTAALSGLIGIAPQDELEGMMAAQLIASYSAAMECYRRAMIGEQTFEGRRENLNQANKLSRSFAVLLDALNRHRGKGQQQVRVEHVHVHHGGQAIVGPVHKGGGAATQSQDQPHAPRAIMHEPGSPMPRPDPKREAVPVASGTGTAPL
jgi:hypothetical protein